MFESLVHWLQFESTVKQERRYIHTAEVTDFLEMLGNTIEKRTVILDPDTVLWRAQLGCTGDPSSLHDTRGLYPLPEERMKPRPRRAREGRANPKGIPFLYLSTDRDTAIGEVRPWVGSYVSVGCLSPCRQLKVIGCLTDRPSLAEYIAKQAIVEDLEESCWNQVDLAFGRPVTRSNDVADYVPTQVIAEYFRVRGFDGIVYRSPLGRGNNIVLFDLHAARFVGLHLFQVTDVVYQSRECHLK
jgi:hypothetical protein